MNYHSDAVPVQRYIFKNYYRSFFKNESTDVVKQEFLMTAFEKVT